MPINVERLAFIDFEASSLGSASFPTEVGWAFIFDAQVRSGSCLIRPTAKWLRVRNAWSLESERLTGITRAMLDRDGRRPADAMRQLLDAVGDRVALSDEPAFDSHWLGMLTDAADAKAMPLGDAKTAINALASESGRTFPEIAHELPIQHRAEADAKRLATIYARTVGIDVVPS